MEQQFYIVRADRAGVFFGQIKSRNGSEIEMTNVRKLWQWSGAAAVEQLAMEGVKNPNHCKFTMVVPSMTIFGVIQIIPASKMSEDSINSCVVWKK